ncbi:hypothetical protein SUGI_1110560 [Cryptomeria japonica]|nr:hypothetical protein SUGI_1110560 [Cryptomeria japonica]
MGRQHKNNLILTIVLLLICCLTLFHESQAVPFSRTLSLAQHKTDLANSQVFEEEERDEEVSNGRRNMNQVVHEIQDYAGPGANNSHQRPGGT